MRAVAFIFGILVAGTAAAETYTCQMRSARGTGWIMPQYSFVVDKSAMTAQVNDPMIQQFIGKPVAGTLDVRSNGNMIINWELPSVPSSLGNRRVVYEAFINPGNGKSWVEASIPSSSYFVMPRGNGVCTPG